MLRVEVCARVRVRVEVKERVVIGTSLAVSVKDRDSVSQKIFVLARLIVAVSMPSTQWPFAVATARCLRRV